MKSLISLGIALCLPFFMHAQSAEKTIFNNISDVYLNYKFSSNFDHMLSNQIGFGAELYDNFDLEIVASSHRVLEHEFTEYTLINGNEIIEEQSDFKAKGYSVGLALSYRVFPHKKIRPIIGVGVETGSLKNDALIISSSLDYLYARLGVEYQLKPWLTLSGNLNVVDKYASLEGYEDLVSNTSGKFLSLSARFSFEAIK